MCISNIVSACDNIQSNDVVQLSNSNSNEQDMKYDYNDNFTLTLADYNGFDKLPFINIIGLYICPVCAF